MRLLIGSALALSGLVLACSNDPPAEPAGAPAVGQPAVPGGGPAGPPPGGDGPPPGGGPLGSSPTEDLSSSWRGDLGVGAAGGSAAPDCGPGELPVPPGAFLMGSQSDHAGRDEQPVHAVTLSGYCLDETEVRVADFAAWLRAEGKTAQGEDLRSMAADGTVEPGRDDHPAEGVTWAEAHAYCAASGRSLPTEAQFEKASRGGCELGSDPGVCDPNDLRPYPWGAEPPTCDRANHQTTVGGFPKICESDTLPVSSGDGGRGPYGHRHLSGNVWELVADTWHPSVYGEGAPRTDPAGPASGEMHVLKGGGWNTFSTNMRAANRFHDLVMGSATGFRCARSAVTPTPDNVDPLALVTLSGTVTSVTGNVKGRALYVTAFDQADTDARTGMLAPGRSPVAEARFVPDGSASLAWSLKVPAGSSYIVSAALDDGSGADKDAYISASGSGGFGPADQNPVRAVGPIDGLTIEMLGPGAGPGGGPGGPPPAGRPGPPPPGGPQGPPLSGPR